MTSEKGLLDVGTHCSFCRQLDFLAFHCSKCGLDFCSDHRSVESHHCSAPEPARTEQVLRSGDRGLQFQSLLPPKTDVRVQQLLAGAAAAAPASLPAKTAIKKSALTKLMAFFQKNKTDSKRAGKPNKTLALAQLRKTALGDKSIRQESRLYLYCYVLDEDEPPEQHALFADKNWSVGRLLDYLAKQLQVRNVNADVKTSADQRLVLYKQLDTGKMVNLKLASRVSGELTDAAVVYLIRGEL